MCGKARLFRERLVDQGGCAADLESAEQPRESGNAERRSLAFPHIRAACRFERRKSRFAICDLRFAICDFADGPNLDESQTVVGFFSDLADFAWDSPRRVRQERPHRRPKKWVIPSPHCRPPADHTAHRSLTTDHRLHRSPLTAHCSLLTAHCSLLTDHRPPTTDHRSLTTDHRPLTTDHRPLTTDHR